MIGWRGALSYTRQRGLQGKPLVWSARPLKVREVMGFLNVVMMIPLPRTISES